MHAMYPRDQKQEIARAGEGRRSSHEKAPMISMRRRSIVGRVVGDKENDSVTD